MAKGKSKPAAVGDNAITIPQATMDAIVQRVDHAMQFSAFSTTSTTGDAHAELEASVTRKIDVVEFWRLVKHCRSIKLPMTEQEPQLDISFTNVTVPKGHPPLVGVRITIIGKNHIMEYAQHNDLQRVPLSAVRVIRKSRVRGMHQLDIAGYDMRINLRLEEAFAMCNFDSKILRTAPKTYRLKNRVSFLSADGMFRYDLSRVHMSNGTASSIISAGIATSLPHYEVETEFIDRRSADSETVARSLLGNVAMLMCVMSDTPSIVPFSESSAALNAYNALVRTTVTFYIPQPVTLGQQHVLPVDQLPPNAKTILSGYTVTEKADGERHVLYVAPPLGKVFLLPRSMNASNIKYLGFRVPKLIDTVLDGELLEHPRMYAVFDAYFHSGKDIRGEPLWTERLNSAKHIIETLSQSSKLRINLKQFEHGEGDDMFRACSKILESADVGDIDYEIDGLIFTPVGALGGTTFKWKPPEMNSVDFLVRFEEVSKAHTSIGLYCRSKSLRDAVLSPLDYIKDNHKMYAAQQRSVAKRFQPAPIMKIANDLQGRPRCENGDVIDNLSIVECYYKENHWYPMKIRHDKVQDMARTKRITANDYNTALSVWKSINRPVSKDNITGRQPVDYVEDPEVYYDRPPELRDAATNMRAFHNFFIKWCQLLGKSVAHVGDNARLLDIGAGKGGDIAKWATLGIEEAMGVDISVDNITNATDGAYVRLMERKKSDRKKLDYIFIALDASLPFVTAEEAQKACMTDDDREVAKILWNSDGDSKWSGFATRKFNIASLMFNLHYFCQDADTLHTLCETLSNMLEPGAVVCGTCMDGHLVDEAFRDAGKDELKGMDGDTTLWMMQKKYDTFDEPSTNYGKSIAVYFATINRLVEEYLVDINEVTRVMLQHGFREPTDADVFGSAFGKFGDVYATAVQRPEELGKFSGTSRSTHASYQQSTKTMSAQERARLTGAARTGAATETGAVRTEATTGATVTGAARNGVTAGATVTGVTRMGVTAGATVTGATRTGVTAGATVTGAARAGL